MKKITTILLLLFAQKGFSQVLVQTKDDAGLGLTSGFFESSAPINYPINTPGNWWHLIDVRHTNPNNNFRMQFASNFGLQKLFFRETNNSPTAPWSKVLLETAGNTKIDGGLTIGDVSTPALGGLNIGNLLVDYTPTNVNYFNSGCNLFLNAKDYTTIGFHDTGTRVDYIRVGQGLMQIGYNGGWGEPNVGLPGAGIWKNNGFVGIGTTNPQEALSVNGNIRAKQVKVETTNWPDYVFEKSYTPATLQSIEQYIKLNKHLPEIPSATEVEKNGLNLGEMNAKLLKKIEEITLHLIDQNKKLEQQDKLINILLQKTGISAK